MIKLQNNYTTPEQSKRLLELGVPRWTADDYRDEKGFRHSLDGILDVELYFQNFPECIPCWSVGRLIEILLMYSNSEAITFRKESYSIEKIIFLYENALKFDFSELEGE